MFFSVESCYSLKYYWLFKSVKVNAEYILCATSLRLQLERSFSKLYVSLVRDAFRSELLIPFATAEQAIRSYPRIHSPSVANILANKTSYTIHLGARSSQNPTATFLVSLSHFSNFSSKSRYLSFVWLLHCVRSFEKQGLLYAFPKWTWTYLPKISKCDIFLT